MSKLSERRNFINAFAKIVKEERLKQSLSQNELAARAGVTNQAVRRLENGERSPYLETAFVISEALGVDLAEMVRKSAESVKRTMPG